MMDNVTCRWKTEWDNCESVTQGQQGQQPQALAAAASAILHPNGRNGSVSVGTPLQPRREDIESLDDDVIPAASNPFFEPFQQRTKMYLAQEQYRLLMVYRVICCLQQLLLQWQM